MKLVLDTNIILASLIKKSITRDLLLYPDFELLLPEYALEEVQDHISTVAQKSGLSIKDIDLLLAILVERIKIIPSNFIKPFLDEAENIIGKIDSDDVPFIALALAESCDGIWSNDEHFKKQDRIQIFTTQDIIKLTAK